VLPSSSLQPLLCCSEVLLLLTTTRLCLFKSSAVLSALLGSPAGSFHCERQSVLTIPSDVHVLRRDRRPDTRVIISLRSIRPRSRDSPTDSGDEAFFEPCCLPRHSALLCASCRQRGSSEPAVRSPTVDLHSGGTMIGAWLPRHALRIGMTTAFGNLCELHRT
jgi:hypothetical protein